MNKFSLDNILSKVVVPLAIYLMAGLFVYELNRVENIQPFLFWGVLSGIIFVVKDIVNNKIVTLAMWLYIVSVTIWLFFGVNDKDSDVAWILLVSIVSLAVLRYLQKYPIVYVVIGYSSILLLVIVTMNDYSCSKLLTLLSIFSFLYAISETLALREKRKGNQKSLILVYSIVSIITFWAPVSDEPYGWEFVENIANTIQETVRNIALEVDYQWGISRKSDIFRVRFLGYSEDEDSFTASRIESEVPQLGLEGRRTKRNLYLKGHVANRFTGDAWKYDWDGKTIDYNIDTLMTMYAIYSYFNEEERVEHQETESYLLHVKNSESIQRFLENYNYQITFKNLKTRSFFSPVKTTRISADNLRPEGDNLQFLNRKERGYRYHIEFLDIDYANPVFIEILQNSNDIVYEETTYLQLYENMELYFGVEMEEVPFETFLQDIELGEQAIQSGYASVDDVVSESVSELAHTIVRNCENDYQKCKALENFLSQYQYNKVISVPDGANVLDWFLFGSEEGYCTHFATALVEMLRLVGIPARMAEGFLVDYTTSEDFSSYIVMAQNAHAWTEAYIEGFGWIRLDATASGESEHTVWYPETSFPENSEDSQSPWNDTLLEEQFEELQKEEQLRLEEELLRKEEEKKNWMFAVVFIGGMLLIVLVFGSMLLIYQKIIIQKSKNPNLIFADMMKLLKKKCRDKEKGETLKEYWENIIKEYCFLEQFLPEFQASIQILEQYWYGDKEPEEKDIQLIQKLRNELKKI